MINVQTFSLFKCLHNFFFILKIFSCLLLRYASQNSLDESSQKHIPRLMQEKPPYKNKHHTQAAFEVLNSMRKYESLK